MKQRRGAERILWDLWIGALQIAGGLILVALVVGVILGKWFL